MKTSTLALFGRLNVDAGALLNTQHPDLNIVLERRDYPVTDPADLAFRAVVAVAYDTMLAGRAADLMRLFDHMSARTGDAETPDGLVIYAQWYRFGISSSDHPLHGRVTGRPGLLQLARQLDMAPPEHPVFPVLSATGAIRAAGLVCRLSVDPEDPSAHQGLAGLDQRQTNRDW